VVEDKSHLKLSAERADHREKNALKGSLPFFCPAQTESFAVLQLLS